MPERGADSKTPRKPIEFLIEFLDLRALQPERLSSCRHDALDIIGVWMRKRHVKVVDHRLGTLIFRILRKHRLVALAHARALSSKLGSL